MQKSFFKKNKVLPPPPSPPKREVSFNPKKTFPSANFAKIVIFPLEVGSFLQNTLFPREDIFSFKKTVSFSWPPSTSHYYRKWFFPKTEYLSKRGENSKKTLLSVICCQSVCFSLLIWYTREELHQWKYAINVNLLFRCSVCNIRVWTLIARCDENLFYVTCYSIS